MAKKPLRWHAKQAASLVGHGAWLWSTILCLAGFFAGSAMTFAGLIDIGVAKAFIILALTLLVVRGCLDKEVRKKHRTQRILIWTAIILCGIVLGIGAMVWFESTRPKPSFAYVVPMWIEDHWEFDVGQEGPEPIYKIHLLFSDLDEKYRSFAVTPEEVQKTTVALDIEELDPPPTVGRPAGFAWKPLDPNHEAFNVMLSYRGGMVVQWIFAERLGPNTWAFSKHLALYKDRTGNTQLRIDCQDSTFPRSSTSFKEGLRECSAR
jgi:hypothetical protein